MNFSKIVKYNLFISFIFLSLFFLPRNIQASIILVNGTDGTDADDGVCSIVEAIQNANADDQSGSVDCVAGSGTDTIVIANNISIGTAFNNGGDTTTLTPFITDSLVIEGGDYTFANTGGNLRLFYSSSNIDLTISELILKDGASDTNGGLIYLDGLNSFTLTDSTFEAGMSYDRGGGAYINNTASVTVSGSYFTENIVDDSSDGDFIGDGGVFYLDSSTATVTNSYFYFNRATTVKGGVFYISPDADLTVSRSTFEDNVAGDGAVFFIIDGGSLDVSNSFFKANVAIDDGAVIFSQQDSLAEANTINFYYNSESSSITGENGGTTFYNCIDAGEGCYANGGDGGETPFSGQYYIFENNILQNGGCDGNIQNASFTNNLDGNLGEKCSNDGSDNITSTGFSDTLEENGGSWKSNSLSSSSNAVDAGVSGTLGCPATDARGFPRPYNSVCDIGAYEYAGPAAVTITETGGSTDVSEDGTTDTYTIVLGGNPSSDVVVDLSFYNSPDVVFPTDSFTFTTLNWFTPQTVNVSAVDDSDVEGEENLPVSHIITSSDVDYGALNPDLVYVNITDNDTSSTSGGSGPTTSNTSTETTPPPPLPVYGCTNPLATNYNPSADSNDGSCILPIPIIVGCTDDVAINYNPSANEDDGSCQYQAVVIYGCTDNLAINHNPSANEDDGSCVYEQEEVIEDTEEVIGDESGDNDGQTESNNSNDPAGNEASRDIGNFGVTSLDLDKVISVATNVVSEKTATSVSAAGLALPVVAFIVTQPAAAASIPIRFWNLIPTLIGLRRKRRPWGTVYDSVTKQPLDPVHVVLEDLEGKQIATTITDLDGRFGFLVQPGKYRIKVYKDNYEFPSRKLSGQDKDELYSDLYFNEEVEVVDEETIIVKNIPMDSTSFNWNEFEKSKNKKLMKFYSKRDLFLARISDFTFYAGIVFSLVMMFKAPAPLNYIIFGVYVVVITLRLFGVKPKKPGYVIDKDTGEPISFGIMRVFSKALNREVAHSVISETGKYYSLVPNGEYFVKIQKKTGEDSYEDISTTDSFKVTGGYIGKVLKV